jgi:hypothetical protein
VPSTADLPFAQLIVPVLERGRHPVPSTAGLLFAHVERGKHLVPSMADQLSAPVNVLKIVESISHGVPFMADLPFALLIVSMVERGGGTVPSTVDMPFALPTAFLEMAERRRHAVPSMVDQGCVLAVN